MCIPYIFLLLTFLNVLLLPEVTPIVAFVALHSSASVGLFISEWYATAYYIAFANLYFLCNRCYIYSFFHTYHLIYIFLLFLMTKPLWGIPFSFLPQMS